MSYLYIKENGTRIEIRCPKYRVVNSNSRPLNCELQYTILELCTQCQSEHTRYSEQHGAARVTRALKSKFAHAFDQLIFPISDLPSLQPGCQRFTRCQDPGKRLQRCWIRCWIRRAGNKYVFHMQTMMPQKILTWFATLLISGSGLYLRFGLWDQKSGIDPRV